MILRAYRLAWAFALPLLHVLNTVERATRALTGKSPWPASWRLGERLSADRVWANGTVPDEPDTEDTLWLHAASLGECKGLWAFAQTLRETMDARGRPARVLLTANTTTGLAHLERGIAQAASGDDAAHDHVRFRARLAPFDHPGLTRRFLAAHKVRALVLFEVELWPHRIAAARRAGVPVFWISARLTPRARRHYAGNPLFAGALGRVLRDIAWIQTQTEDEEHALRRLGAPCVETGGDLRGLHSLRARGTHAETPRARSGVAYVSIHARELPELARSLPKADASTPESLEPLWVFPRKPEEIEIFARVLAPYGFARHSENPRATRVIVDRFGLVESTLACARAAVIGGSFGDDPRIGGHNLWEPLLAGCEMVIGPHHHNQRALAERLQAQGLLHVASPENTARDGEEDELARLITRLQGMTRDERTMRARENLRHAFVRNEAKRLEDAARHACDCILQRAF